MEKPNKEKAEAYIKEGNYLWNGGMFLWSADNILRQIEKYLIIKAFNKIKKQGYNYQLVIYGKKGWLYDEIFDKIKELKLEDDVIFTDYVTDEELEVLYKNAKLFVFPSLYEGFGFPPIEAMARKVPVLTSREGALPEIVGDAALFCNAYDVYDIASSIIRVIEDDDLIEDLINKGLDRCKFFSWDKTAKQIHHIYKSLLINSR